MPNDKDMYPRITHIEKTSKKSIVRNKTLSFDILTSQYISLWNRGGYLNSIIVQIIKVYFEKENQCIKSI